ncbi:hypothetical protein, partial [Listeria booriae]|uniref:hypothetical protein n=1 Tax=Listeria booriae TaxID=1552123 RepID=UPI001C8984F7
LHNYYNKKIVGKTMAVVLPTNLSMFFLWMTLQTSLCVSKIGYGSEEDYKKEMTHYGITRWK